jgi:hypothetical protein
MTLSLALARINHVLVAASCAQRAQSAVSARVGRAPVDIAERAARRHPCGRE